MDATTNSYTSWFVSRINELKASRADEQSILAFMGMSPLQARLLASVDGCVPGAVSEDGFYSPEDFKALKREAFRRCLMADSPVIMLYEQLLAIKGALSEMYPGKIYVVQNNLFTASEGYPSPVQGSKLATFTESLNQVDATASGLSKYYAMAQNCEGGYLVSPIKLDEELEIENLCLYESARIEALPAASSYEGAIPATSTASLAYRLRLSNGTIVPVTIEVYSASSDASGPMGALAALASQACLPARFAAKAEAKDEAQDTGLLLPILKRYWGDDAEFRSLSFYSNPDFSNEMELLSQGAICEFAAKQALYAHEGNDGFRDILLTAPTGAGKSILFQLPALYLAQELKTVTLVIEPLKALMTDQVANLRTRGVGDVVAINSDIAYEERMRSYEKIKDGSASIIYLSPELLLESSLETILNGRDLGLVIIDEVHTVTSWGKDFRPDYWYLGPYLSKLRKAGSYRFPIFCLTATAVYGGRDDVVNQTIRDLELSNCRLFLGNPRRKNLDFAIRLRNKADFTGPIEGVKTDLAIKWIKEAVAANEHAIVYCPYRSQVGAICDEQPCGSKALGYHGGMDKEYKKIVGKAFKIGSCRVLVSTKAFGMGIDIDDISAVYHYAPTGNLSDYVQEIGRGGRKRGMRAVAAVDFFMQDTRYAEQLYALSRFTQWQLKEIMSKLYEVYSSKPKDRRPQNFLVSPNSFSYLFASEKDEGRKANRVKSGLMMIARDLEDRFNYPVLIVRPKMSYTKQYVCIDAAEEERFAASYGKYFTKVTGHHTRYEDRAGQNRVAISDMGSIYELNMGEMWSNEFAELTFADFKRQLFTGEICGTKQGAPAISNRMVLDITFSMPYEDVSAKLARFADALDAILLELGRHGDFTDKEFKDALSPKLDEAGIEVGNYKELLNTLVRPIDADKHLNSINAFKCVSRKSRTQEKSWHAQEPTYGVIGRDRMTATGGLKQTMSKLRPREGQTTCRRYLHCKALGSQYALAEILQVLNLATYTVRGGDNPEIFIRLNDPLKIHSLSLDKSYSNNVLRELNDRHSYSSKVIRGFFTTEMEDSERWDLIEEYFLGNDDYVAKVLGISERGASESAKPKVRHGKTSIEHSGVIATMKDEGVDAGTPLFRVWNELINSCKTSAELQDLRLLKEITRGAKLEAPRKGATVVIESTGTELRPLLAWKEKRVLLFAPDHADEYAKATGINWKRYLLGQGETIAALADDIKPHGSRRIE